MQIVVYINGDSENTMMVEASYQETKFSGLRVAAGSTRKIMTPNPVDGWEFTQSSGGQWHAFRTHE